ncbi:MAG: A/G-specific adenine glycosylase (EC [uncultured Sulfurovum sp.]|uniref:Adenine DNA glycosylase n=1 Tax=uncultured Sulfurovum sp. TaxID=269237 RepID=A0A6S6U887_9BACT|nr:MAG: A/G-specific adenine glycosylase (EC [uncultured Sulfurovum sp.]
MQTPTQIKILTWYKTHGRLDLPWRTTDNPYHIYVSEVMLQQTQVKTVLERFYFPFLKKFPTLQDLAEAPLDAVLKMWEGLGYYNRAKNLHKTAEILTQEGQIRGVAPTLPSELEELIKLPGIGKNTAHAVATFAYKKPVPIMEANVKRILCRLHTLKTPTDKELWNIAYKLVDNINPFDYNQAMMDIGSSLCTPKNPHCTICPLSDICKGKEEPTLYPTKKKRMVPTREQHIMLHLYNDRLSLTQRKGKFLHGLWGFEDVEVPLCASEYIGEVTHAYTHFKLVCKVYVYDALEKEKDHYFTIENIRKLAISKVDEKIVKLYLDTM